jgi:hypothetical protein
MKRKLPFLLAGGYVVLVLLSVVPIFVGDDTLSGIFAVILTSPWPALLDRLLPEEAAGTFAGLALIAVGSAINALIIYGISRCAVGWVAARRAGRKWNKRRRGRGISR